jgi:tetratricopeptide (TPR) repeat protein
MADELFRSADVLVRRVNGHGGACCVVTFDSFTDFRTLDRPGFAEHFLSSHGIDAIHVIPRDNDWYQHPDMAEAMSRIHAATRDYARVVTYGSSMGAYAAIRLAGLAGANVVLALSPQYSIDRSLVPWERRWIESSALFRPVWERDLPLPQVDEAYVLYDPNDDDRRHIALLARKIRFTPVHVQGGGHPVTGFLAEIGLLQETILDVCRGRLDPAGFAREVLARRETSAQYKLTLAKRTSPRRHGKRIALMREAVRLAPTTPAIVSRLGVLLGRARRFEEAFDAHRRALELAPGHPNMLFNYSVSLEASGDIAAALAAMEEASACANGAPIYRSRLDELRARAASGRGAGVVARLLRWRRKAPEPLA